MPWNIILPCILGALVYGVIKGLRLKNRKFYKRDLIEEDTFFKD
jgi:hypothetical protein